MEKTKKFLTISIGISIILCSLSLLVISIKGNTANAQALLPNGYVVAGLQHIANYQYCVVGYNAKTGDVKALATFSSDHLVK